MGSLVKPSIQNIKRFIRITYPFYLIIALKDYFSNRNEMKNWLQAGRPIPPPHCFKTTLVKQYARKLSIHNFIETGTYMGQMVYAVRKIFDKIYSIELDGKLFLDCCKKFNRFNHIHILQGDSGDLLPIIISDISEPCLFWLDAHYSGGLTAKSELETPIMQEINSILSHRIRNHCILIDDARMFVGQREYPTIERLKKYILSKRPDSLVELEDDVIRITFH